MTAHLSCTSYSSCTSPSAIEMEGRRKPLSRKLFILDIENKRNRQHLQRDIERLGGVIVPGFETAISPCCVVSDYQNSHLLEKSRVVKLSDKMQKKLPLLLRCALESHVRVRSVETFQKSLDNLRTRLRVSTVEPRNPDRTRMLPPAAPNKRQHEVARSLASPYVKLQDARGHYAPQLKEYLTSQQLRIHLRNSTGKSIFHAPTSNARVARTRMPPQAPNPNRAGFCEVCTCQCDNMNQHFASRDHQVRTSAAGFFDEVDSLLGSFDQTIACPGYPFRLRENPPAHDTLTK